MSQRTAFKWTHTTRGVRRLLHTKLGYYVTVTDHGTWADCHVEAPTLSDYMCGASVDEAIAWGERRAANHNFMIELRSVNASAH